jgi:hypothetical protein
MTPDRRVFLMTDTNGFFTEAPNPSSGNLHIATWQRCSPRIQPSDSYPRSGVAASASVRGRRPRQYGALSTDPHVDRGPERAPIVVKHLHNFVLDCWYETGLIGVGALFLWLGVFFARGARRWRVAAPGGRAAAGTLLAGSFAIIAAGLFSFSYLSKPFAVYLPLFLGALAARGPDR